MTKWFYRAVGTVGVAGGFLLLAGGAAQADDAPVNDLRGSLDGFFQPMGPSGLAGGGASPAAPLNGLANLSLGGQAVNPVDTLGALPLDPTATVDPAKLGATDGAARAASDAPVSDPAPAAPSAAPAPAGGGLPVVGGLLGGGLGGGLPVGGDLLGGLPLLGGAAPAAAPSEAGGGGVSAVSGLPVASTLPALGEFSPSLPSLPSLQNFDAGQLVPSLIGDALSAQQPELFAPEADPLASIPLVGDVMLAGALAPPPAAGSDAPADAPAPAGGGGALGGLPLLGSLGSLTGGGSSAPTADPAPAPAPAQPAPAKPAPAPRPAVSPKFSDPAISPTADDTDRGVGRHRAMSRSAAERPVAGEDPEFTESTRVPELEAPALNLPLPLVGNLGNLGGLLGGGAAPADPAAAPAPSDLGIDPDGGPTSVMDV